MSNQSIDEVAATLPDVVRGGDDGADGAAGGPGQGAGPRRLRAGTGNLSTHCDPAWRQNLGRLGTRQGQHLYHEAAFVMSTPGASGAASSASCTRNIDDRARIRKDDGGPVATFMAALGSFLPPSLPIDSASRPMAERTRCSRSSARAGPASAVPMSPPSVRVAV